MWVIVSVVTTIGILNSYYWLALYDDLNEHKPTFIILLFLGLPYWFMYWALKGPRELFKASGYGVEYHSEDMTLHIVPWQDIVEIGAVYDSDGSQNLKILFTSPRPRPYHGIVDELNASKLYFHMEGRTDVRKIALSGMELRNAYLAKTH
jgi:hypothetical protein